MTLPSRRVAWSAAIRGIVLAQHADGLDEPLAQVAGDLDLVAEDGVAVRLDQHHVAVGEHLAGALVVADLVGRAADGWPVLISTSPVAVMSWLLVS